MLQNYFLSISLTQHLLSTVWPMSVALRFQSKPMNNFGASMNKLINGSLRVAFDRSFTGVRLCLPTNRLMDIHWRCVHRESYRLVHFNRGARRQNKFYINWSKWNHDAVYIYIVVVTFLLIIIISLVFFHFFFL